MLLKQKYNVHRRWDYSQVSSSSSPESGAAGSGEDTTELAGETNTCGDMVAGDVLNDAKLVIEVEIGMYEVVMPLGVGLVKTDIADELIGVVETVVAVLTGSRAIEEAGTALETGVVKTDAKVEEVAIADELMSVAEITVAADEVGIVLLLLFKAATTP